MPSNASRTGRLFAAIGAVCIIGGMIWLFTGRHYAIAVAQFTVGAFFIILGTAAMRRAGI